MNFSEGDIAYSIEDEELGYIMKVEITSINENWICFENEAIETELRIEDIENVLFKTYDEAAKYIKSLGIRPKILTFTSDN